MTYNAKEFKIMDEIAYKEYKEQPPRYVYKYYSNLKFAFDAISNDRIHLERPSDYNDIFDAAITIKANEFNQVNFNDSLLEMIIYFTHRDYKNIVKSIDKTEFENCKNLNDAFDIILRYVPKEIVEETKECIASRMANTKPENNRIACFSEINDEILMWAHYANHLRGVCLVFDTTLDQKLFSNLHKVNYSRFRHQNYNGSFNFYFEKSLEWSYEQEWRIVIEQDDEYISTKSCIGIIYSKETPLFPCELTKEEKAKFDNITAGEITLVAYKKGLKVYKAIPDKYEYKINIKMVDCKTSFE